MKKKKRKIIDDFRSRTFCDVERGNAVIPLLVRVLNVVG